MPKKIVSAGHNAAVLKLRNAVIGAGYQVVHNQRSDLILDIARKGEFSAVVICSSIPAYQRKNLAKELKRIKPGLPLVMIFAYTEHAEFRILAEEVAEHGVSQPLVEAISKVMGEPEDSLASRC